MRISFSVFFLFLYSVEICRSRDELSVHIPENWKKVPIQKPINNQKNVNVNNKKSTSTLGINLPNFQAPPVKRDKPRPMVNLNTPIVSPKMHISINPINETLPKFKREPLHQQVNVNVENISKCGEFETVDCNIDRVLEFNETQNTLNNTINKQTIPKTIEKADSEEHGKPRMEFNKSITENLVNNSKILDVAHENDQNNKNNDNKESHNNFEIMTNKFSKNNTDDLDNTRNDDHDTNRKSNIELVINHNTYDGSDANIIIHSDEFCEFISGANNKVRDFSYQNEQDPAYTVRKVMPYDYGQFTRNQYTKTLSDEENYANICQLGTVTNQDNKYPLYGYTQYEADILPNGINCNVGKMAHDVNNDHSNDNNIWRSAKNTNVIIRNNPRNIKLFLNYGSSGNKNFNQRSFINSHSNYRNLNNFRPYYPRYVYNCI